MRNGDAGAHHLYRLLASRALAATIASRTDGESSPPHAVHRVGGEARESGGGDVARQVRRLAGRHAGEVDAPAAHARPPSAAPQEEAAEYRRVTAPASIFSRE